VPLAGDPWSWLGLPFELVESKLRPPSPRSGIVPRTALLDRLRAQDAVPIISVVAPAGYGKSTLLAQWAERKGRRVGWVSVDQRDNDPTLLLTYLAVAVDRIKPIDPVVFRILAAPRVSPPAAVIPHLVAALSSMTQPVALVLDHLELLTNVQCLDAVAELAVQLPAGSQLALGSRSTPPLPVGLLRAQSGMVEIGVNELAMGRQEAVSLLNGMGVNLAGTKVDELVRRTEGWPVGLYLAALANRAEGPRRRPGAGFTGDHRLMAEYLRSELLAGLPQRTVSFMTRTAVLERMCGPLCDAVLDASGSARVLSTLEDSNLLLIPLDRRRRWYRYHHLLHELLRAELERREPELVGQLHARAAAWFEANGMPEVAIDHAQAAGDADRVARLVWDAAPRAYASGRRDTAIRWYDWFEEQGLIEHHPLIAIQGVWRHALLGQPAGVERWLAATERAVAAAAPPQRDSAEGSMALLRAALCRHGVERMRTDAQLAQDLLDPGDPARGPALHLEGTSYLLTGQADRADPILARAVEVATHHGEMNAASYALAQRSLVAIERQDWQHAESLAEQAVAIVRDGHLDDYVSSALVYAVGARTALHRGDLRGADECLARAARLRPLLTYALPTYAAQALLELARAYLALGDTAGARMVLRQARDVFQRRPDLGILPKQAEQLQTALDTVPATVVGASSLTTAELRLLPLLSTHLTFRQIGERLHLSRHTVKSHALAIYRKLGVSSRNEAVQRMRQTDLLP
jgi:LuxR family transcriptional regulator, maltose regulon positive regulatory protein